MFGRIFTLFEVKKAYLLALGVFMLGSLICGIAFNSTTLIVGRAIAGFGSAGITTGSFVVVAEAVPLQSRPIFMALVGLM
jgi:Major Facilitator Superfamily.